METEWGSMYSPKYDGENHNEFEKFLLANQAQTNPQLKAFLMLFCQFGASVEDDRDYSNYEMLE